MYAQKEEVMLESACSRAWHSANLLLARQQDGGKAFFPPVEAQQLDACRPGCRADFEALAGDFFTSAASRCAPL